MKKIMLVDDAEIANFITASLIGHINPQYPVYNFTEPVVALTNLDAIAPDVIFLDLNMPVMDGWEFLEKLEEKGLQHKVYILTSSTSKFDRQRATNFANVEEYLVKPINKDKLSQILQQL
ncbi:response regulator [Pontibacter qinzhouensis]|uniref:Response regulator n=1 Tax=Pontibacter qinzhouensis TaxID=2603253 RepID=A0A5C8KB65_9BACT|nr:response regulator [Pontibacter qinzhouensis]TXK51292.1 response regulator [Pontibacter qinzhouensis]